MTTEEIEKAVEEYAIKLDVSTFDYQAARKDFREGADFANKHWQEKTRWKSLEKEPPSEYGYGKMYLLRAESGIPYLVPFPYKESIKEFIDSVFIEWKEIE